MQTTVREIMTTRVIWVRKDAQFRELAAALRRHRVSAFPVLGDADTVIGVVSEADMLTKEALDPGTLSGLLHYRDAEKARGITAGDLMTHPVVTAAPEDTAEHAAQVMYKHKVKRLPVVDPDGRLLGIVSRADVLAVFDRTDEDIRKEIIDEVLLGEFAADPRDYDVKVGDGVVTLAGTPESDSVAREIVQRVRHVQGVVAVRDRLTPGSRFDVPASFPTD